MKGLKTFYLILGGIALISIFIFFGRSGKKEEVNVQSSAPLAQTQTPQTNSAVLSKRHPMNNTLFTDIKSDNGQIKIPLSDVDSGKAKFYTYAFQSKNIDFFVVKTSDGTYRAAADACQVCYGQRKGYFQEGNVIVCRNCGNRFPIDRIALEKSGCNPAPISAKVKKDGSFLVLNTSDVEAVSSYF